MSRRNLATAGVAQPELERAVGAGDGEREQRMRRAVELLQPGADQVLPRGLATQRLPQKFAGEHDFPGLGTCLGELHLVRAPRVVGQFHEAAASEPAVAHRPGPDPDPR